MLHKTAERLLGFMKWQNTFSFHETKNHMQTNEEKHPIRFCFTRNQQNEK